MAGRRMVVVESLSFVAQVVASLSRRITKA